MFLVSALVRALGLVSKLRGKPAPVTPSVLQIFGRYAWYDTTRARTDLGWQPRPLKQTVEDTCGRCADRPWHAPAAQAPHEK